MRWADLSTASATASCRGSAEGRSARSRALSASGPAIWPRAEAAARVIWVSESASALASTVLPDPRRGTPKRTDDADLDESPSLAHGLDQGLFRICAGHRLECQSSGVREPFIRQQGRQGGHGPGRTDPSELAHAASLSCGERSDRRMPISCCSWPASSPRSTE